MTRLRSRAHLAESALWASRDGQTGAPQRSVCSAETRAIRDESPLVSRATTEAGGHELRRLDAWCGSSAHAELAGITDVRFLRGEVCEVEVHTVDQGVGRNQIRH